MTPYHTSSITSAQNNKINSRNVFDAFIICTMTMRIGGQARYKPGTVQQPKRVDFFFL